MPRRVNLPGADELFRATSGRGVPGVGLTAVSSVADRSEEDAPGDSAPTARPSAGPHPARTGNRRPSGRERHDEKITVYVSPAELVDLESVRLRLRADHGVAVDRGRIVREAIAVVLADFEAKGLDSILVRRLRDR